MPVRQCPEHLRTNIGKKWLAHRAEDILVSLEIHPGLSPNGSIHLRQQGCRDIDRLYAPFIYCRGKTGHIGKDASADGKQHTIYIDDLELLPSELPSGPVTAPFIKDAKGYERHIDISWNATASDGLKYYKIYRSTDGINFEPIGISRPWMHRYTDYIGKTGQRAWYRVSEVGYDQKESPLSETAEATTRPMTDDELLDMVQEAQFRYYWDGAEPTSGLARENIPGRGDMIAAGASGFGMMATIVGGMSQRLTRKAAAEFSFFLAVPTMLGATCLELYKLITHGDGNILTEGNNLAVLIVGYIVAYIVAFAAIKFFISYVSKYGF